MSFQLTRSRGAWRKVLSLISSPCKGFQLTRSRGAWPVKVNARINYFTFQLTRSRGAWPFIAILPKAIKHISTHTLTWSVTILVWLHLSRWLNFNSHAHVERDLSAIIQPSPIINFNSHAHVERDVVTISSALKNGNFNSHAHVERDIKGVK